MRVKNNYGRALLGLLAGLAMFAIAPVASAEISIPGLNFNPSAGDESLKMIGTFFGTDGGIIKGNSSVMGALMNIFNGAVLSLASIFAFYTIVSAVVQTAHDGEVLGKRYSSLWVPIRSAAGIAAIVPAGGFSAVQMMVLFVAAQGVGLSNQLWVAGVDSLANNGGFSNQVVSNQGGNEVVRQLVPIAACLHSNSMAISKLPADYENRPVEEVQVKDNSNGGYKNTIMNYGFKIPDANFVSCGQVSFAVPDSMSGTVTSGGTVGGASANNKITAAIARAQTDGVNAAIASIRGSIANLGDGQNADSSVLTQAAANFDAVVTAAAQSALSSAASEANSKYRAEINSLKDKGWSAAGGSFMALSKLSYGVNVEMDTRSYSITAKDGVAVSDETIQSNTKRLISQAFGKLGSAAGVSGGGDDATAVIQEIIGAPFKKMTASIADIPVTYGTNPILYWKNIGDNVLNFAGIVVVLALTAIGISGFAQGATDGWVGKAASALTGDTLKGASGAASSVLRSLFMLIVFMTIGFVTIGVTLAVYLPMLPYIIWVSVLLSWMVAVAEAVIASPLWMMLHLNPEGDGIASGATEAGYKFVAAIFLRPALSVISFFVACAIMFAIGGFVNMSIKEAYDSTRADNWFSFGSLFALMGYFFVVGGLGISIVSKSFNLCLTIPETILRWIGSSMTGGESLTGETKNEFTGGIGVVQNSGTNALTPGQRGFGRPKGGGGGGGGAIDQLGSGSAKESPAGSAKGGTPERPKATDDKFSKE